MSKGVIPALLVATWLWPAQAHAGLRTAVLPPSGDKVGVKLADQVEFNLEDSDQISLEARERVIEAMDKQNPFGEAPLARAMETADLDVLIRVVKGGKPGAYSLILYDRDGLDVETVDAGVAKAAADTKAVGAKAALKVAKTINAWESRRSARVAKRDAEKRKLEDAKKKEDARKEAEQARRDEAQARKKEKSRTAWQEDAGDDELAPPPSSDGDDPPRDRTSFLDDEEESPAAKRAAEKAKKKEEERKRREAEEEEERRAAEERRAEEKREEERRKQEEKARRDEEKRKADDARKAEEKRRQERKAPGKSSRVLDPDEPADEDEIPKPPPDDENWDEPVSGARPKKKPAPKPAAKPAPKYGDKYEPSKGIEGFAKNLYTLREPIPYFTVSVGPSLLAWSYTLMEAGGKARALTCSPTVTPRVAFSCIPHGGADLWLEAWPIRYLGFDTSARVAGTVYPPAQNGRGEAVTTPATVISVLSEGHVAAKARFVMHFGPLAGAGGGVRMRVGYARNLVQRQKPFTAIPGYHAAQLGLGVEGYLPLLWKTLGFDARAEIIPLVYYQEIAGIPADPLELAVPGACRFRDPTCVTSLNNPGTSGRTVGARADVGMRGAAPTGIFVELRLFTEGYVAVFTGTGDRKDVNLNPIPDGRVVNITIGATVAVGWLFPKGLKPIMGDW